MDIWAVAAAAGAGYVAKYWQKLRDREGLLDSPPRGSDGKSDCSPLREHLSRLSRRGGEEVSSSSKHVGLSSTDTTFSETNVLDGHVASEMASTSGVEFDDCGNFKDWNVLSLSSFPPELSGRIGNQGNTGVLEKCSVRSKRFRPPTVKSVRSIDNSLRAQLYKEHVQVEEYLLTPYPSPSRSAVRPLVVSDGSRIISRPSCGSYRMKFGESKLYKGDGLYSDVKDAVIGVPPLPEISNLELPKNLKQKKGKGRHRRLSSTRFSCKQLKSQGLPDGIYLFTIGITLGVMSTIIAKKREIEKLNEALTQTQNFVQDLQEELEMKDSLTVKELVNEGSGSQQTSDHIFPIQAPTSFCSSRKLNDSLLYDARRLEDPKLGENSDGMSKIEAELEAELERLEMNMKSSMLERRLSGVIEVDPDFVADIVEGELRVDMVNGGRADSERGDDSGKSTGPTQNVNYAVSPRGLSLRLHEVIQSRLEERIVELEAALENSQKRVECMEESREINIRRNYSNMDTESSTQESPRMMEDNNVVEGPFFLNLSGDALDAYNEACEEFMRSAGKDEEDGHPVTAFKNKHEELHPSDNAAFWGRKEPLNVEDSSDPRELIYKMSSRESIEVGESEDEEFGRLLIKEIVEKARQGSPVVLNAQRMLFSMDDDDEEPHLE